MVIAVVATLGLAGSAFALMTSGVGDLTEIASAYDTLGTDSTEMSGATWNADFNRLLVVDNGRSAAYEFALDASHNIDSSVAPRKIELNMAPSLDVEGVAWISGNTYAFVDERFGNIHIADVPETGNVISSSTSTISIVPSNYVYQNKGPEGLAWDGTYWYVPTEKYPPRVDRFSADGVFAGSIDLSLEVSDTSGVAIDEAGNILALSDENSSIRHYEVSDWMAGTFAELGRTEIDNFSQAEGIAIIGNRNLHVVGESGNQTYAHLAGDIVVDVVVAQRGDTNCSGSWDVEDASFTMRIAVGLELPVATCADGDNNDDGVTTVADVALVLECTVGLTNVLCP